MLLLSKAGEPSQHFGLMLFQEAEITLRGINLAYFTLSGQLVLNKINLKE